MCYTLTSQANQFLSLIKALCRLLCNGNLTLLFQDQADRRVKHKPLALKQTRGFLRLYLARPQSSQTLWFRGFDSGRALFDRRRCNSSRGNQRSQHEPRPYRRRYAHWRRDPDNVSPRLRSASQVGHGSSGARLAHALLRQGTSVVELQRMLRYNDLATTHKYPIIAQ